MWILGTMAWTRSLGHVMMCYPTSWLLGMLTDALYVWKGKWMDLCRQAGQNLSVLKSATFALKGNWDKIKVSSLVSSYFYDKIMSIMYKLKPKEDTMGEKQQFPKILLNRK